MELVKKIFDRRKSKPVDVATFSLEEMQEKITACEAEVKAALDKHGCELAYDELHRNGQVIKRQISVVLKREK